MVISWDGHTEIVKLLLEHGAGKSINAKNHFGQTALMFASRNKHTDIVKLLKEAGATE